MANENRLSRIADALRANLRRRKQQARGRKPGGAGDAGVAGVLGPDERPVGNDPIWGSDTGDIAGGSGDGDCGDGADGGGGDGGGD